MVRFPARAHNRTVEDTAGANRDPWRDDSNRDGEQPHPAHSRPAQHQLDQMCVHTGDCEPAAIVLGGMILSSKEIMRRAKSRYRFVSAVVRRVINADDGRPRYQRIADFWSSLLLRGCPAENYSNATATRETSRSIAQTASNVSRRGR